MKTASHADRSAAVRGDWRPPERWDPSAIKGPSRDAVDCPVCKYGTLQFRGDRATCIDCHHNFTSEELRRHSIRPRLGFNLRQIVTAQEQAAERTNDSANPAALAIPAIPANPANDMFQPRFLLLEALPDAPWRMNAGRNSGAYPFHVLDTALMRMSGGMATRTIAEQQMQAALVDLHYHEYRPFQLMASPQTPNQCHILSSAGAGEGLPVGFFIFFITNNAIVLVSPDKIRIPLNNAHNASDAVAIAREMLRQTSAATQSPPGYTVLLLEQPLEFHDSEYRVFHHGELVTVKHRIQQSDWPEILLQEQIKIMKAQESEQSAGTQLPPGFALRGTPNNANTLWEVIDPQGNRITSSWANTKTAPVEQALRFLKQWQTEADLPPDFWAVSTETDANLIYVYHNGQVVIVVDKADRETLKQKVMEIAYPSPALVTQDEQWLLEQARKPKPRPPPKLAQRQPADTVEMGQYITLTGPDIYETGDHLLIEHGTNRILGVSGNTNFWDEQQPEAQGRRCFIAVVTAGIFNETANEGWLAETAVTAGPDTVYRTYVRVVTPEISDSGVESDGPPPDPAARLPKGFTLQQNGVAYHDGRMMDDMDHWTVWGPPPLLLRICDSTTETERPDMATAPIHAVDEALRKLQTWRQICKLPPGYTAVFGYLPLPAGVPVCTRTGSPRGTWVIYYDGEEVARSTDETCEDIRPQLIGNLNDRQDAETKRNLQLLDTLHIDQIIFVPDSPSKGLLAAFDKNTNAAVGGGAPDKCRQEVVNYLERAYASPPLITDEEEKLLHTPRTRTRNRNTIAAIQMSEEQMREEIEVAYQALLEICRQHHPSHGNLNGACLEASVWLQEDLQQRGVPCQLVRYENPGHWAVRTPLGVIDPTVAWWDREAPSDATAQTLYWVTENSPHTTWEEDLDIQTDVARQIAEEMLGPEPFRRLAQVKPHDRAEETSWYTAYEAADGMVHEVLKEYVQHHRRRKHQPWAVAPAARLKKIWMDFGKSGIIRDEKGLNEIADRIVRNIFRLHANTVLCGHSTVSYDEYLEGVGLTKEQFNDENDDWFTDPKSGQWRISDYALDPLMQQARKIMSAVTAEEKLYAIDKVLNITHQRSQLADWFVEGGIKTLNAIFEYRPEAPVTLKHKSKYRENNDEVQPNDLIELRTLERTTILSQTPTSVTISTPDNVIRNFLRSQLPEYGYWYLDE